MGGVMSGSEQSGTDFSGSGPVEYTPTRPAPRSAAGRLSASEEERLLAIPGVTSVGLGLGHAGGEAIVVGVVDAGVAAQLPSEIGGLPIVVDVTGEVDALPRADS
jgi:hypothetical protein